MSTSNFALQPALTSAIAHHQAGRLAEAERIYRQILAHSPRNPDVLHLLGVIAHQVGQHETAVELIQQAIREAPQTAPFHSNLGEAFRALGRMEEAIASFRRAVELQPDFADAHNNLGSILAQRGEWDQAIACYQRALASRPEFAFAHNNLANAWMAKGRLQEAIAGFRRALASSPQYADAHNNLGYALLLQGHMEESLASYQRRSRSQPGVPEHHSNLGHAFETQGRRQEAIACYQRAIALQPEFGGAHFNLGMVHLLEGRFPAGWQEYEWRWKCGSIGPPRDFSQPQWEGSQLDGRTILLHGEQGIGDVLQFIRYVPLVRKRGGRVLVECQAEIVRLLSGMPGIEACVAHGAALPDFAVHCPLLSLPRIFSTTLENMPHEVPYLSADARGITAWSERIGPHGAGLKVGLAWAGNPAFRNDRLRSPRELSLLSPLTEIDAVTFYSLQKGDAGKQAKSPPPGMRLIDLTPELHDFSDTAALVANLHLVITSDTAVAHLAGAMGKPVWVMLPFSPDWRWLLHRADSPWYPTMRLFRQPKIGDWEEPVRRMADALRELAAG